MKTKNYRKLPYDKAKLITTAVKVKDGGATTVPVAKAIALRVNGKWVAEADALPRGASVPVYRCVDGETPAAACRSMWQYLADIAERNLTRCWEMMKEYSVDRHSCWLAKVQEGSAKYAASLANCRAKIAEFDAQIENERTERRIMRERKEAEIVRNGSSAYIDAAAEKASERYIKIEERVNKRTATKAANTVKAA